MYIPSRDDLLQLYENDIKSGGIEKTEIIVR